MLKIQSLCAIERVHEINFASLNLHYYEILMFHLHSEWLADKRATRDC